MVSAEVACIVGEVVPRLFPPRELCERVVPIVYNALADACAFVATLAAVRTLAGNSRTSGST
jgi:hypothetical protein